MSQNRTDATFADYSVNIAFDLKTMNLKRNLLGLKPRGKGKWVSQFGRANSACPSCGNVTYGEFLTHNAAVGGKSQLVPCKLYLTLAYTYF